ncbi:MAG: Uma2 family endonuclease [Acidimicrobiales bacterium]
MRTVVLGPRPAELDALIARRQKLGLDGFDEVWEGEYHMAPMAHGLHGYVDDQVKAALWGPAKAAGLYPSTAFNLGEPRNFRVPDGALHRAIPNALWLPTAALVIEIVSPDDESWLKLGFYAAHGVDEVLIADPRARSVDWLALDAGAGEYQAVTSSGLVALGVESLSAAVDWPPVP